MPLVVFKQIQSWAKRCQPVIAEGKKNFYGIRARRKRRRISSCLAEELEADIQSAVPEQSSRRRLKKTSLGHREALIFQ